MTKADDSRPPDPSDSKTSVSTRSPSALAGPTDRAESLVRLFCRPDEFGVLRSVEPSEVPAPARTLLDHGSHMTVAMERFHGGDMRLRVVAVAGGDPHGSMGKAGDQSRDPARPYAREILLETQAGRVVQFGIVRIHMEHLDPTTAAKIREAGRPLGRILIDAGMLREVQAVSLLEIVPRRHLRELFGMPQLGESATDNPVPSQPVYGRVADIRLDGRPAIELLEIVAPESPPEACAS